MYDSTSDFHLKQDSAQASVWVENRRPGAGEQERYVGKLRGVDGSEGYALIASLANLGGTGNVLILAGTDMSSTEAAGNLLTTESFIADLLRRLPPAQSGQPPRFEALLRTTRVENANRGFEVIALHPH